MFMHQLDSIRTGILKDVRLNYWVETKNKLSSISIWYCFSQTCIFFPKKFEFSVAFSSPNTIWTLSKCSFLSVFSQWSLRDIFSDLTMPSSPHLLSQDAGTWYEKLTNILLCPQTRGSMLQPWACIEMQLKSDTP